MVCVEKLLEKRLHLVFGSGGEDEWLEQLSQDKLYNYQIIDKQ